MKSIHKSLLTSMAIALAGMSNANGALTLSVNFILTENGGPNTNGFLGSSWTFKFQLSDTVYSNYFEGAAVLSDGAMVTIAGAGNSAYNGDFAISETTTTDFLFWPNFQGTGSALLAYNPVTGSETSFSIGNGPNTLPVVSLALFSGSATASASIGGPVLASHFDGLVVSDTGVTVGDTVYGFNNGTITVIPEPSTLPLVALSAGIVLAFRRRK